MDINYSNTIKFSNWQSSATNILWGDTKIHVHPKCPHKVSKSNLGMLVKPLFCFISGENFMWTHYSEYTLAIAYSSYCFGGAPESWLLNIIFQMCVKNIICESFIYINFDTNGHYHEMNKKEIQHTTILKQKDVFMFWLGLFGEGLVPCRPSFPVSHYTGLVSETTLVYNWIYEKHTLLYAENVYFVQTTLMPNLTTKQQWNQKHTKNGMSLDHSIIHKRTYLHSPCTWLSQAYTTSCIAILLPQFTLLDKLCLNFTCTVQPAVLQNLEFLRTQYMYEDLSPKRNASVFLRMKFDPTRVHQCWNEETLP